MASDMRGGESIKLVEYSFPEWLFVDRNTEFDWIRHYLSNWVRIMEKGPFGIELSAKRRIGKTAFLEKLVNEVLPSEPDILPFPIFLKEEYGKSATYVLSAIIAKVLSTIALLESKTLPAPKAGLKEALSKFEEAIGHIPHARALLKIAKEVDEEIRYGPSSVLDAILRISMEYAETKGKRAFIIIDEFQTLTRVEVNGRTISITDGLKGIVESAHSPVVLVSGSAVGMMLSTATNGILAGRFTPMPFEGLSLEAVSELCNRWAKRHNVGFTDDAIHTLFAKTLGIPGYIVEILRSLPQKPTITPADIDSAFTAQTSPGGNLHTFWSRHLDFWSYLHPHLKDIEPLIAYLASLGPMSWIKLVEAVSKFSESPRATIRALQDAGVISLSRAGYEVSDPVLCAVVAEEIESRKLVAEQASTTARLVNEVGILAELLVADVVSRFDGRKMPGKLFGQDKDVTLPAVTRVETRVGAGPQVDVVGFEGPRRVIEVEVKWRKSKLTAGEAKRIAKLASRGVTVWVISRAGFHGDAARTLRDAGVWFSDANAFNRIRTTFGFPEVKA